MIQGFDVALFIYLFYLCGMNCPTYIEDLHIYVISLAFLPFF